MSAFILSRAKGPIVAARRTVVSSMMLEFLIVTSSSIVTLINLDQEFMAHPDPIRLAPSMITCG
jgi:hypothetical protein